MRNANSFQIDALESRRLLSGSHGEAFGHGNGHHGDDHGGHGVDVQALPTLPALPTPAGAKTTADYATAQTDLAAATAALTKLTADQTALQTDGGQFATDRAALRAAVSALLASPTDAIKAAQDKLTTDEKAERDGLKADYTSIQAVYTKDNPAILTDLKNIATDLRTRNSAQLTIDKAQLTTDKATLESDLAAPLAQLKTDDDAFDALEEADRQALQDTINSDPTVAPLYAAVQADQTAYQADLDHLQADRTSFIMARNVVLADIKTLKTDIAGNL